MSNYLIYGANGYTGRLIACEAAVRGQRPILAGRNKEEVEALARELGLESRIFSLDEPAAIQKGLEGMTAVLHCAGPFVHTARPMADACLETHVHYLDITGEIAVFEMLASREPEAMAANIMFLPGVGFDVVPSDCLAAHLKKRLPSASHLALGIHNRGRMSRGTATTMIENIHRGGAVRQNGKIVAVPAAYKSRDIDMGGGVRCSMTIPWGDVSTAYHSTGIPNIEVYMASSPGQVRTVWLSRYLGWLLRSGEVQLYLKRRVQKGPAGPSDEERAQGESLVWGEASDPEGSKVVSRLKGPEGYTFTMLCALAVVEQVLQGKAPAGFQTPSLVFGPDFVTRLPGVLRTDE